MLDLCRRFHCGPSFVSPLVRSSSVLSLVVLALCGDPALAQGAGSPRQIQASAWNQIETLLAERATRTPAERKVDSRLLLALKKQQGATLFDAVPELRTMGLARTGVEVDLQAEVTPGLLQRIEALGGTVVNRHPRYQAIRAVLPPHQILALAESPAVRSIRPAEEPVHNKIDTSEGDVAHAADTARTTFGVDGTGVHACAMSDSVESLATLQGSGDLPAGVTVLSGQAGTGTSEGTALLEILHDLAPGAQLSFATGEGGEAQMAQNILDLAALGCDVIVDDVQYLGEGVFQDDVIAQAVETVSAQNVLYFSAAGNAGNLNDGTSGVWEGNFVAIAGPGPLSGVTAHDFGGGTNANTVTVDSPFFFTLQWSDPLGGSANDYNLFLLDSGLANILAASISTQDGNDDPLEFIDSRSVDDTGNALVIVQASGANRFLHLNTNRGQLSEATAGQISGHSAASSAFSVAAVDWFPTGLNPFEGGAQNPVETFSSDGPRRIFFDPNGSPVSLVSPLHIQNGVGQSSVVRQKPDIAAADGVSTATPGFDPFFGTSASAPHAAGIGALLKELIPDLNSTSARFLFNSSTLDIENPGIDRDSGAGILMTDQTLGQPIFVDGFESGDTSAWTSNSP